MKQTLAAGPRSRVLARIRKEHRGQPLDLVNPITIDDTLHSNVFRDAEQSQAITRRIHAAHEVLMANRRHVKQESVI